MADSDGQMVEVGGVRIHARLDGPNGAPWVVFANSILTDLTMWDDQVAALDDRYRILRYDQRGHGRSEVPDGPVTIAELGADLSGLMDRFGVGDCILVGLSMGVPTVLDAFARNPGRVRALVLSDGQAATVPGGAKTWAARIEDAREMGMERNGHATAERWFGEASRAEGRHEKLRKVSSATAFEGFFACASALQGYDYADVLPRIAVPVLTIVGGNDKALMPSVEKLHAGIAGARMEVIPDAGHLPNVEQPEAFNRVLAGFLDGLDGGRG
ncbi:alpha/beta fold hydrolase [Rhodobacterales bacterium HKCCE2091]|nr:alpha/beta fold hydrolase [Rhodobacterales bacterium HKCCE2091]